MVSYQSRARSFLAPAHCAENNMTRIIQDLRIGTKLAIASVLSILLVGAMIYSQLAGNSAVRKASLEATAQQTIVRDAVDAKASIRGMQIGVRDTRLAGTAANLQVANDYTAARLKSVNRFADEMLKLSHSAENRGRIEKLKALAGDYAKGAQQISSVRSEAIAVEASRPSGGQLAPDAAAKSAKLNDDAAR